MATQFEIVVAGAGLAGLTATLALLRAGYRVANIAPVPARPDRRTTALLDSSVKFLDRLGVGAAVRQHGNPLKTMRIVDATERLFRAPQLEFHASEIGLENFGFNVTNAELARSLRETILQLDKAAFHDGEIIALRADANGIEISVAGDATISAEFVVGADGRGSAVRRAAGIAVREWSYPQEAVVLNFSHELPHDDISTEFHTPSGPFTTVPLGRDISSLVWVESPTVAANLKAMALQELELAAERRMHSMLGKIKILSPPQSFPLSGMIANRFGNGRAVIAGEAAHVFPPIGAQGFNLGIRDIQALASLFEENVPLDQLASRYDAARRTDVATRTLAVDVMNRSLLTDFLPIQAMRGIGLAALGAIGPIRRMAMKQGIAPGFASDPARPESGTIRRPWRSGSARRQ